VAVPGVSLFLVRNLVGFASVATRIHGLIWEAEQGVRR
jgi:hypothetical protein